MGIVRSITASHFLKVITHEIQGNIVIIVFDSIERNESERKKFILFLAQTIVNEMKKSNSSVAPQIGIGRFYPSNMKLYKSFHEGKVALELGKYELKHQDVWHFEDIGIAKLLANIQTDILHDYYIEVLGELIQLDRGKDDFYLETLQEYFRHNGDVNKTANELFVHPNTLRKRIKKIESVLNCDLSQMDDQLKILVALRIMKMLI